MSEIAPLVRRQVEIEGDKEYPELGIRSFGKGTFHKPAITGAELGGKRIYQIESGDLMFSNVFAWEGAIAVAKPEDHGRYGSHRFISRVPDPERATAKFLCFHFLSEDGLRQIQNASPGSAGRNRTLGLQALDALKVPVPPLSSQKWFDALYDKAEAIRQRQGEVRQSLEALFPSILDKAYKGEL
jgi:type I restriction enzyme, S subunit